MSSESDFSPEQEVQLTAPMPAAPTITSVIQTARDALKVVVALSTTAKDGGALASPLTKVLLFYKASSMQGSTPEAERQAGTPFLEAPLPNQSWAPTVEFDLTGLTFTPVHLVACVDA